MAEIEKAEDFSLLDDATFAREMGLESADETEGSTDEQTESEDDSSDEESQEAGPESEGEEAEAEEEGEGSASGHEKEGEGKEERKLATPFVLKQGEEEVEIPTDLMISFDRHGKQVSMPLDKIVRLAKDGFHNRDLQAQADRVPELEDDLKELDGKAANLVNTLKRLLTDEEYFLQTREKYELANTPEARATRAEQELEETRRQKSDLEHRQNFTHFVRDEVQDVLAEALEAAPDVDPEKVTDWVAREIKLFQPTRNAPPPRSAFREILKIVREEIVPRIADEQARNAEVREARELKAKQGKIEERSKKAKRLAAGAVKPAGKGGGSNRPKPKEIVSMEDATADIINNIFAA